MTRSTVSRVLLAALLSLWWARVSSANRSFETGRSSSLMPGRTASNQVTLKVDQGLTPLMLAARDQERDKLTDLLKHQPDLASRDEEGWTALTYAAMNGNSTIVKALIGKGADLNSTDNQGMTPLMHAASLGQTSAARLLIDKGAEVNAKDNKGQTALTFAQHSKSDSLVKLLQKAGAVDPVAGVIVAEPPDAQPAKGTRPVPLNRPMPSYTEKARQDKVQGIVRINILVAKDGSILRMRAITGLPDGLTYEAYRAALQMHFKPATKDGEPVNFWQKIEVEFNLRR